MIPAQHSLKQMRESQRQRSLGLSTQQRLSHLSGRAHPKSSSSPSALNPHSPAFKSRVRPHGAGGSHVKWGGSKHELADERRIAVGEALSDEDTAHIPATTSHAASPHAAARDTAREVALVDLVAPDSRNRRQATGDEFEIVRVKGVIALDDDAFQEPSFPSSSSDEDSEEFGGWDMMEDVAEREVAPKPRSWASIVKRS